MLEFLRRLFAPEPRSSETAKERLRLVLLSDHLSLAPDVVEALKRDLLAVISRYLEIDPAQADVTFEQREREVAMLASIPIMGVRERAAPPPASATIAEAVQPRAVAAAEPAPESQAAGAPDRPEPSVVASAPEPGAADADPEPSVPPAESRVEVLPASEASAAPGYATPSAARRRRRKKAAAAANRPQQQPSPAPGFKPA